MTEFKEIKNIIEILSSHNKNLLFLKLNKQLKLLISSMPIDIKCKLMQDGVVCDVFKKYNNYFFRIRVYHPSLAQDLKNDSTKKAILNTIKLYKKYRPDDKYLAKLDETEIIINHNQILKTFMEYKIANKTNIILKDLLCVDFCNLAVSNEHKRLIEQIRENRVSTNAKIKSFRKN